MRRFFNKLATGVMVATMAFTALAPVTTMAAEACSHQNIEEVFTKKPTCTEGGIYDEVCEDCGKHIVTGLTSDPTGHYYGNIEIKNNKVINFVCTNCGDKQQFTPIVEESVCMHNENFHEHYNYTTATCIKNGYTGDLICTQCGKVLEAGKSIPKTGHDWKETDYIKPTCTTDGKKIYYCHKCDEEKEDIIKAVGHKWDKGAITLAPTTTTEGKKEFKCTVCRDTKTETLAKLSTGTTTTPNKDDKKDSKDSDTVVIKETLAKVGTKYTVGGNQYTVIKAGKEVRFSKANAKKKSVIIPATIKVKGITYKVASIGTKAFKNNKKIKKVIIGYNVKVLKSKAFYNCPNLKQAVIKSTQLNRKAVKKGFSRVNKKLVIIQTKIIRTGITKGSVKAIIKK